MITSEQFSFSVPADIVFGIGSLKVLPEKVKKLGLRKVFLLSDEGIKMAGLLDRAEAVLEEAGIDYEVYTDVASDPDSGVVGRCGEAYKNSGADGMVCLGGGSTIDTGKIASVVARYGGTAEDYEKYHGPRQIGDPIAPLIAIPTTAGTGSEVTPFAAITSKDDVKMIVGGAAVLPKVVILDPSLITSQPFSVAASTCVDALCHAVEGYIALASSDFSDLMLERAIELMGANIRAFVANRKNIEAAANIQLACTYSGIGFGLSRLGNIHAMTHPLGSVFHLTHGVAISTVFTSVLSFNAMSDQGKYLKMYRLFTGRDISNEDFCPQMFVDEITQLLEDLKLPTTIGAVGITEKDIERLTKETMETTTLNENNPRQTSYKDMEQIFRNAL